MENKESTENNEIKVNQYFTYVGPFIIFLGMARLITFYTAFGISITSYLEFSEIITSFFDIIFIVFLFYGYTLIQNFLMSNKEELEKANSKRQEILKEEKYFKIWWLYIKYLRVLLAFGLIAIVGCIISHYWFNSVTTWTIFLVSSAFGLLLFFIVVGVEIERKHLHLNSTLPRRRFIYLVLYSLALTFCVAYYSSYQARSIKNDKTTLGVTIILDNDKTIVSDSTNYYIGKTQNYLFVYHEKEKTTDVYPMARIKQMTMTNKTKK